VRPTGPYRYDERGLACEFSTPAGLARLDSPLLGRHNLENLSLALALCIGLGLELEASTAALNACPAVPGRLERCDPPGGDIAVFVDYAHTPDALEKVLSAVRPLTAGRVVCVFGCGGDRDRTKRPLMGEIAGRLADEVVVTSDNPRSEPPERIAAAVVAGLTDGPHRWQVELDRAQAIAQAIAQALPGDLVLIAGKGHETRQVVGEQATDFDDRVHARAALAARRYSLL
jgi:UDP-N-acetylmuramoyl-L-alanyl-D-glutamate--2,6-diaminopimelate ligase